MGDCRWYEGVTGRCSKCCNDCENKCIHECKNNKSECGGHIPLASTTRRYWTDYEKEQVVELYRKGKALEYIALELNRTEAAITRMASILRKGGIYLPNRNTKVDWDRADVDIIELFSLGANGNEIAEELGISSTSVNIRINQLGLRE